MKFNTLEKKSANKGSSKIVFTTPTVVFIKETETIAEHIVTDDEIGRIDF